MYPAVNYLLEIFGMIWIGWMSRAVKKDYELAADSSRKEERELMDFEDSKISSSAVDATHIISQVSLLAMILYLSLESHS
jgi:hypothetical protein